MPFMIILKARLKERKREISILCLLILLGVKRRSL